MKAIRGEGDFRGNLGSDADITAKLSQDELDRAFDLEHALRFAETIVERAING
ncbi:MAG: hypothetical protein U0165_00590 [Polyangiaceae bacterium]